LKITRSESSVFPFLVPRHKVWLTPTARVPCSNAAITANTRLGDKVNFANGRIPFMGQEPPKMYVYTVNHKNVAVYFSL